MSQQNARILDQMYDAVLRRDLDRFVALHDPGAEVIPLILDVEARGYHGHEGLRRFWSEIHSAFPDWHWEVERVEPFDQGALVTVRICGRSKAGGMRIDQRAWHLVKVRHANIVWWRVFRAEAEARQAARSQALGTPLGQ
jgi:hypothetical protein